jgi:hypothetical protein
MNDIADCRAMELLYRQRAKADPQNSWKWLGQAERWHKLGRARLRSVLDCEHSARRPDAKWGQTPSKVIYAEDSWASYLP